MLPTLADGDQDRRGQPADRVRLRDGIYVIRLDGVLLVKRLAVNPATRTLSHHLGQHGVPELREHRPAPRRRGAGAASSGWAAG
jgi:phage repressor protein C with HTH and peptisase S24 domain